MIDRMRQGAELRAHDNGLGFLRLLFAGLVIVSHTIMVADGNSAREPLYSVFGTVTLGELAVDGFFLISGYLIVASFLAAPSTWDYLQKRLMRIYPAFAVASALSVLLFAPLGGADAGDVLGSIPGTARSIVSLKTPAVPGVFEGLRRVSLNTSMWSISYEFRCYILVVLLGVAGLFRRPAIIAALAVAGMALFMVAPFGTWSQDKLDLPLAHYWIGRPGETIRLTGIFLTGSLFYLWRDRIVFTGRHAAIAGIGFVASLCFHATAGTIVAVFGGYLLFGFARRAAGTPFSRINSRNDISYGVYLYGWPIGSLILWSVPGISPRIATVLTMIVAVAFGWASWLLVERPAMRWLTARRGRTAAFGTTVAGLR